MSTRVVPPDDLVLRAGGLAPLPPGGDGRVLPSGVEVVGARRYRHPVIGERAVVRLVPEPIGQAEDLALETLDFALDSVRPVALGRPRGLGFPASAILADPPNARHALAVVKEMERYARMAKSKPGNAKVGFDEIGTRLARSVPQFLPSFYEQAGRAFIDAGNNAQAASAFGQARAAERTYALPVDESRRRQAFLEFALAGALTAKSISEYARELVAFSAPAAAHAALKELVVQRTLGGLPPWSGMAPELRRTAKAAGLDVAEEEAEVLRQLLEAPATAKASAGFWEPYRAALGRIARSDPAFRGRLLNFHPRPPERHVFADWWVALLRDAGALDGLLHPDGAPPETRAVGGAGAWLERAARQAAPPSYWGVAAKRPMELISLIAELGPIVRAAGRPVDLFVNGWGDLDIIDAAVAAGIELAPRPPDTNVFGGLNLRSYVNLPDRAPLLSIDKSPQMSALLDKAIAATVLDQAAYLAEIPGLHPGLRRWMARQVDDASEGTLQSLAVAVANLKRGAVVSVRAVDPEGTRRIGRIDVAAAVARTIRGGLLAELTWPALESADVVDAEVGGFAWPALILSDKRRAVVVGPAGVVLSHDSRHPPSASQWWRHRIVMANGQLYVGWRDGTASKGYWSGRPNDQFEPRDQLGQSFWAGGFPETSVELPDGSRCEGGAPVVAGDTSVAAARRVVSDGTGWWVVADGAVLRELDPATGRAGRASRPKFFEEWVEEGWTLDLGASWLMPLPAGADASAIGTRDGLIGFRARSRTVDGREVWQVEGVDGRRFEGEFRGDRYRFGQTVRPVALLTLPGDPTPRLVTEGNGAIEVLEPSGRRALVSADFGRPGANKRFAAAPQADTRDLRAGLDFLPPARFWHAFRPRDEAGSAAMRALTDAQARRLLDAAAADRRVDPLWKQMPASERAIAAELPAVRDAKLREGLRGALRLAADTAHRLEELAKTEPRQDDSPQAGAARPMPAPAGAAAASLPTVLDDLLLKRALLGLQAGPAWEWGISGGRPLEQVDALAAVVDRPAPPKGIVGRLLGKTPPPAPTTLPSSNVHWFEVLPRPGAVAFKAALATTPDDQRWSLSAFLRAIAERRLAGRAAELRVLWLRRAGQPMFQGINRLSWTADRVLLTAHKPNWTGRQGFPALEWGRGGRFGLEAEYTLEEEWRPGQGWADDARVLAFLDELGRRGPLPWDASAVEVLTAATGMGRGAAALVLGGLPRIDVDQQNFLPTEVRELMGIKVAEAKAGAQQLRHLTTAQRLTLLDAAMPAAPADLWAGGMAGAARRIAERWTQMFGRQIVIDDALGVAASKALVVPGGPRDPLRLLADPADPRLTIVPKTTVVEGWSSDRDTSPALTAAVARSLAVAIPWAHMNAPVGEPLLTSMASSLAAAQATLREPTAVLSLEYTTLVEPLAGLLPALGAQPWRPPRGVTVSAANAQLVGPFVVVPNKIAGGFARIYLLPSLLLDREPEAIVSLLPPASRCVLTATRFLLTGADAIAQRARSTQLEAGRFEADPSASAPATVDEVAAATGLTREAATLLLQIMALPGPTKALVLRWNGWTAGVYTKVAKALLEKGLVVQAQRARAGRDLFLGGPWASVAAPDLPIEAWKLPLYGATMFSEGTVAKPLDRLLPLVPLHELFARAWARWQSGDRPAFEQPGARR